MTMTATELRQIRAELGVTGAELAHALGVNDRTIRLWESGLDRRGAKKVPHVVAFVLRLAVRNPTVRRELGLPAKAPAE
jgi:DNA-binding transcriptional regulator YiaG